MSESVMDLVSDLISQPATGDSGDSGDNPRHDWARGRATLGDHGRFVGAFNPANRPESPRSRPAETRATKGESPKSPESPSRRTMRVFSVRVAMLDGTPPRWVTMLAPGADLPSASHAAYLQFGRDRVLAIREYRT